MSRYLTRSMLLYLERLVDWDTHFRFYRGEDADVEAERSALRTILETAAEICESIEPEARAGWEDPARLEQGEVVLPPHVARGYERLRQAGLVSFGVQERFGGPELPALVTSMILEMIARADSGLMTIVGLQAGVATDIQKYASQELCERYLPRFVKGEVQGAMDLTEPQAGSDLGGITTRAVEQDGRFFLEGQKIWITNGGSEVHLVLARDADTYEKSRGTTRGLSLFLCPRTLPDGTKNRVVVERLEHKLGIHGSPTAAIRFERAEAWRVGVKGEGFKAMLDLMNDARLGVAAQGIGIAAAALAEAIAFSRQRVQFGIPIGDQPLMKNMLARMVLAVEGSRALLYRCGVLVDRNRSIEQRLAREVDLLDSERGALQKIHERNTTRIRFLTPLAKYVATENANQVTRTAIQVHGGLGFMAESAVGKLHSDSIITTIYEGTSEIQVSFALKEIGKGALLVVFDDLRRELDAMREDPFDEYAAKVRVGIDRILGASGALLSDFNYALLCARRLADGVAAVIVGTELLAQARVDARRFDLAASWINRGSVEIEASMRRIAEGTVARVERCEKIVALAG